MTIFISGLVGAWIGSMLTVVIMAIAVVAGDDKRSDETMEHEG